LVNIFAFMAGRFRFLRKRGGYGRPSEAPTPLPILAGEPTENPTLSTKKKNTAGGISKMNQGAVFSGGAQRAFHAR